MARSTKPAVLEDEVEETVEEAQPTTKQIVNAGIDRALEAIGTDVQKNRYKVMRAIAFQAFTEAIEADDFEGLVDRAIANVDDLPSGWEIERPVKDAAPAKAAPAKKAPAKAAAKPAAKPATATARKRPAR